MSRHVRLLICLLSAWTCGSLRAEASIRPGAGLPAAETAAPVRADRPFGLTDGSLPSARMDIGERELPTAVYDLSAHVVVLPDGARLEAHSGLGGYVDDPRFVRVHMRGPTPPGVYELAPRKGLFHGIAALRLLPLVGDVFGRTGLLAHTYMLHGRPESNGCVVFRDYGAFLRAYREGRVQRLRVVPGSGDAVVRDGPYVGDIPARGRAVA